MNSNINTTNPYLISFIVSMATFMEVLDTTIANVALSHIAGSLGATSEESTWVLTSYLVSNGIVLPLSGWLAGVMGRKNFFMVCILCFTVTSLLCGLANSLGMLILFRLLQGIAGGGLQPMQQAIIKDSFPLHKLGTAFAITGITVVLAPIIGPMLGGYITDNFSWRWIFFINIPVGLLALYLVNLFVEDTPESVKKKVQTIDYIGLSLIALGLGALQIFLDKGQQEDWFDSNFIIFFAIIAVIGLVGAVIWLLRQKEPVVKLSLFSLPSFSMPSLMIFFVGFALYSSSTLLPMMVQSNFGYDATLAGMVLSPSGLVVICIMPIIGKLVNKVQAKYLISTGMFLMAFGMWATAQITPQSDYWTLVQVRILQVIGLPFLFVPSSTLAFSKIKAVDSSNASAIVALMRNLGGSIGIAIVTNKLIQSQQVEQNNIVQHLTNFDIGYNNALYNMTNTIKNLGFSETQASQMALGKIYRELMHQASLLAYADAYEFVATIMILLGIIALFMPKNELHGKKKTVVIE